MKDFNFEFETIHLENDQMANMLSDAFVSNIKNSLQLAGIKPCNCGKVSKFKIFAVKNSTPKIDKDWCCLDFSTSASKYFL